MYRRLILKQHASYKIVTVLYRGAYILCRVTEKYPVILRPKSSAAGYSVGCYGTPAADTEALISQTGGK